MDKILQVRAKIDRHAGEGKEGERRMEHGGFTVEGKTTTDQYRRRMVSIGNGGRR